MAKDPNTVSLEDLELSLQINEHQLETACSRHPDLFYRVSKRLAHETSMRDAAKEQLANMEALVDVRLREEAAAEEESKKKVTDKAIESMKRLDPKVETARKRYMDLTYSVAQWTALKDAFTQRSYMLKTLGELYVSNYYSDTSVSGTSVNNAQADRAKRELQAERVRRRVPEDEQVTRRR